MTSGTGCVWFFGLSLLEPDDVEDAFSYDIMSQAPTDKLSQCTKFADYVLSTFVSHDARFPAAAALWATCNINTPVHGILVHVNRSLASSGYFQQYTPQYLCVC